MAYHNKKHKTGTNYRKLLDYLSSSVDFIRKRYSYLLTKKMIDVMEENDKFLIKINKMS